MMVLVDTSVWVTHFREGNTQLAALLNRGEVMCHPFIIGEIACGTIRNRKEILSLLQLLPQAIQAKHEEVLEFIETFKLMGKGLGYIDIHLSASARLTGIPIWTFDKKFSKATKELGISFYE
jgi:predicted nucleic acid-binding protein